MRHANHSIISRLLNSGHTMERWMPVIVQWGRTMPSASKGSMRTILSRTARVSMIHSAP